MYWNWIDIIPKQWVECLCHSLRSLRPQHAGDQRCTAPRPELVGHTVRRSGWGLTRDLEALLDADTGSSRVLTAGAHTSGVKAPSRTDAETWRMGKRWTWIFPSLTRTPCPDSSARPHLSPDEASFWTCWGWVYCGVSDQVLGVSWRAIGEWGPGTLNGPNGAFYGCLVNDGAR